MGNTRGRRLWTIVLVTMLSGIALSGCITKRLTSRPYEEGGKNEGIAYALPKAFLEVKADYSVFQKSTVRKDATGKILSKESGGVLVLIDSPVSVTSRIVADRRKIYVASPKAIANSALLESDMTVDLSEGGNLKAVSADIKDKSPEIAKSVVKSAISVAKLAVVAGAKEEAAATETEMEKVGTFSMTYILDPETMTLEQSGSESYKAFSADLDPGLIALDPKGDLQHPEADACKSIPVLTVRILIPNEPCQKSDQPGSEKMNPPTPGNSGQIDKVGKAGCEKINGIVYRTPAPVTVEVFVNRHDIKEARYPSSIVNLPQYGALAVLPISSKSWTDRTTSAAFSESVGSLTQYKIKSGSSALSMAKTAEEVLQNLVDARTQLMQYEIDLLAKKAELDKARAAAAGPDVIQQLTESITKRVEEFNNLKKSIDDLLKLLESLGVIKAPSK